MRNVKKQHGFLSVIGVITLIVITGAGLVVVNDQKNDQKSVQTEVSNE